MSHILINDKGEVQRMDPAQLTPGLLAWGTSRLEIIQVSYGRLVEVLGEPNAQTDEFKIDASWVLVTPEGIATIYNWKGGQNYLGGKGLSTEAIEDWHIGGHSPAVVPLVKRLIGLGNGE